MRLRLEHLTADEQKELPYDQLLKLRADAYRRHVDAMEPPAELLAWAERMTQRYGPTVKAHHQPGLPWIDALLVARYGEEPSHWPTEFIQADLDRATGWMRGKKTNGQSGNLPKHFSYNDLEDGGWIRLKMLWAMLAIFVGANLVRLLATAGMAIIGVAAFAFGRPDVGVPIMFGSALSNFWENELIDHLFRARSYTAPTDHYIALYTAAPGETGGGTEVSGGSYARVQVAAGFANWEGTGGETTATDSAGTAGGTQNRNAITFPSPTANWGVASHFASLDASTSGNFFFYGALTTPKTINNGDPAPSFAAGDLDFALA